MAMNESRPISLQRIRVEPARGRVQLCQILCAAWVITFAGASHAMADETLTSSTTGADASMQRVSITANAGTYEPTRVRLIQGVPAILEFTRVAESTCMQAVRMPWLEDAVPLPLNETVEIQVDTSMTGVFTYACSMDMVFGDVVIE